MNNKALVAIAIMLVFVVPIGLGFLMNMEDVEQRSIVENNMVNITSELINGDATTAVRYTGGNNNDGTIYAYDWAYGWFYDIRSLDFVLINNNPSTASIFTLGSLYNVHTTTIPDNTGGTDVLYEPISTEYGQSYQVQYDPYEYVRLTFNDGSTLVIHSDDPTLFDNLMYVYGSTFMYSFQDGGTYEYDEPTIYSGVKKVELGSNPGSLPKNIQVKYRDDHDGRYGQPAYGWKVPSAIPDGYHMSWLNGFSNTSISLMIDMGAPGTAHTNQIGTIQISQDSSGTITYGVGNTDNTLGKYRYLNLIYDFDSFTDDYDNITWTLKGISQWPSMGANPQTLKTVTMKAHENSPRYYLEISEPSTKITKFRVDYTYIIDSPMGVINNNSYDAKDLYPETTGYTIQIDSALVYGSSIAFAGHTYTITDGQITVNGIKYDVVGSKFTSIYDTDTSRWNNLINGSSIGSSASNGTITFNGISSMEVSQLTAGYHVDTKSTQWVPGHFAFNVSDYALIGLITSIAAFIILGMAGIRSGGKVLWLAAICGGAAIIFITLI